MASATESSASYVAAAGPVGMETACLWIVFSLQTCGHFSLSYKKAKLKCVQHDYMLSLIRTKFLIGKKKSNVFLKFLF